MKGINSSRVSLAMSGTALFVALGGSALAVTQVTTSQIRNGAVTGAKLKNGAVSGKKLGKGAVSNAKLANGSVGASKLAPGAVGTTNIAAGAVTPGQIGAGAVTAGKLGAGAVGSANIGPGAVTSANIGSGAVGTTQLGTGVVTNGNLANNAVTSSNVLDGSLTSSDVAPNTFLAANGKAANSQQLDGLTAIQFVQGTGKLVSNRISVPAGSSAPLLELDFGFIQGSCPGSVPTLELTAELPLQNVIYTAINNSGTATDVQTFNAVTAGSSVTATHAVNTPQSVTWQAAYNDGNQQLATAWTAGQDEGGTCVFTGQALTTL